MAKQKISIKERIVHAVGYELIAAGICAPVLTLIFNKPLASTGALALSLSLFAMMWNAVYNTFFDKWCSTERSAWTMKTRVLHGIGFELGIITFCLPIGMWMLNITLLEAFLLEAGFFAFVLPYTIVYNWAFEKIKISLINRKSKAAIQ